MTRSRRVPWVCAVAAAAVGFAVAVPQLRSDAWSPTAIVGVGASSGLSPIARQVERGFRFARGVGYDGQFYWGVGVDPLATGRLPLVFDKPTYRYGHPLYGWLAWLGAAAQPSAVAASLLAVGLLALAVAGFAASSLALDSGRSGWLGLCVVLSPGLITSAARDLAEPLAAAILLCAARSFIARRRATTWILIALAPLAKEPLLMALAGMVGWLVLKRRRGEAAVLGLAAAPALAWWSYLRVQLGAWFTTGGTALAVPFAGWWSSLAHSARLDTAAVVVLLGVVVLILLAAVAAVHRFGPLSLSYLGLAAVALSLAGNATAAFETALRTTSLPLALIPFL